MRICINNEKLVNRAQLLTSVNILKLRGLSTIDLKFENGIEYNIVFVCCNSKSKGIYD